ncbi:DNA cytosine methyltransferase [Neorhizobium vignae]|uniref:DNA cytosine methyltransferase n=1 Tax=Neorhizobium vignae TaxID=690585 RepID=UPI000565665B|nr:DNA cytosine methyltransferase [Neorhizobium vignae]
MAEHEDVEERTELGGLGSVEPHLRPYRERASAAFYRIIATIKQLRENHPDLSDGWIASWLERELEITKEEATALARVEAQLGRHIDVLESNRVSAAVVYALLQCESDTKDECLAAIESGIRLVPADVERIRAGRAPQAWHPRVAQQQRRAKFNAAALAVGRDMPRSLKTSSRELLELLNRAAHTAKTSATGGTEHGVDADIERIREKAAVVAHYFQATFGEKQPPRSRVPVLAKSDMIEAAFLQSWHALSDLQQHVYSPNEIASSASNPDSLLFQSIAFLAGTRSTIPLIRTPRIDGTPPRELLHVDVMAGIGGASLGLETAGFAPAALFEPSINARRILQDNRRAWPLKDYTDPSDLLRQCKEMGLREVDLVTSGTMMFPFSPKVKGTDFHRSVFDGFILVVRDLRPRAVFFGVDPSMMTKASAPSRAEIENSFDVLGYGSRWIEVQASRAGLPKTERHHVLVAMSRRAIETFEMPVIINPVRKSLWHAIGNLAAPGRHRSIQNSKQNSAYEAWYRAFKTRLGDGLAPAFTLSNGKFNLGEWEELSIDISKLAEELPAPELVVDPNYKFKLTRNMLASINGFPLRWRLTAALDLERRQLDGAISPIVAKMVGLALYPLLTGKSLDYERAVTTPLLHWPTRSELFLGPPPPPLLPRPPSIARHRPRKATSI